MYLTLDKTIRRKASELFLTYRMEHDFSKEQILAAYLNVIPYGQRSYGIAAAAQTYYGKQLGQLTVAQAATLAGIGQRPSDQNPITNPKAAEARRAYVLRRMKELHYIDEATAAAAAREPVASHGFALHTDVEANHVAELARQEIVSRFGKNAVNLGYKVFTTLDGRMQTAANSALRTGLMEYDRRHGYRGSPWQGGTLWHANGGRAGRETRKVQPHQRAATGRRDPGRRDSAEIYIREQGAARINWDGLSWAKRPVGDGVGPTPRTAAEVVKRGDVIYGRRRRARHCTARAAAGRAGRAGRNGSERWRDRRAGRRLRLLHQQMESRDPGTAPAGFRLQAFPLFGGAGKRLDARFDNQRHARDNRRQRQLRRELAPGEFQRRFPRTDAVARGTGALAQCRFDSHPAGHRRRCGDQPCGQFGFDPKSLPRVDALALGTQTATPLQMATAYTVFANGGFKVDSYLITRIEDEKGKVVFQAQPKIACPACEAPEGAGSNSVPEDRRAPRVLSAQKHLADVRHHA